MTANKNNHPQSSSATSPSSTSDAERAHLDAGGTIPAGRVDLADPRSMAEQLGCQPDPALEEVHRLLFEQRRPRVHTVAVRLYRLDIEAMRRTVEFARGQIMLDRASLKRARVRRTKRGWKGCDCSPASDSDRLLSQHRDGCNSDDAWLDRECDKIGRMVTDVDAVERLAAKADEEFQLAQEQAG